MPRNHTHELTVQNLYDALLHLMDIKPYREIRITELAKEAGVSRMAFYRNYQDISDILIGHLRDTMQTYQKKCRIIDDLTEKNLWVGFFREMRKDPIFTYLRKAELMDSAIDLQKHYAEELYVSLLQWDMEKKGNRMILYQRMGSMMGLLMYLADFPEEAEEEQLADQILAIVTVDKAAV